MTSSTPTSSRRLRSTTPSRTKVPRTQSGAVRRPSKPTSPRQTSPLSAFFGPSPQGDTTEGDDILDTAAGFVESDSVEEAVSGSEHGDSSFRGDAADMTEHVVVESSTGEETDTAEAADDTEGEHGHDSDPARAGFAATLGEALPQPGTDMGGPAEEDALARLVREAMQEAVDSARKND